MHLTAGQWIRFSRRLLTVVVFAAVTIPQAWSEDSATKTDTSGNAEKGSWQKVEPPKMAELKVVLKDTEGHPIKGGTAMPYAMRVKEQQGHGYWIQEKFGPPKPATSNEQGIAVILYPPKIESGTEVLTTRLVTFLIKHSDFVQKVVHFDLGPPEAEVTLDAGCEVQLSAIDENGNAIPNFAIMMSGPFATDQWVNDGQGGRRTRAIKDGTWQTLLVSIPESGPVLFSGILPFSVRPKQAVKLRNVRLSPGTRLKGSLSADVPRPIKNGRVIATVVPKPAGSSYEEKNPSLVWHECTGIDEMGNFEYPSLPRGGEIQIIAHCEGWLSKTTMTEARNAFVMGQLFPLEAQDASVTVEMEPTGTLEVTVVKPDGSPLQGATVSTWPNQCYHKGGSTILGQEFNSRLQVLIQLKPGDPANQNSLKRQFEQFTQKTDAQGKAILKGLPIDRNETLALEHPKYQLPLEVLNNRRWTNYRIASTKSELLEIKVQEITAATQNDKGK